MKYIVEVFETLFFGSLKFERAYAYANCRISKSRYDLNRKLL